MQIVTYLNFDGRCREAFGFYAAVLGGEITFSQTFGESPMADQVGPEWQDRFMHATIAAGGALLMGSDAPPDHYHRPAGFSVSIQVPGAAEAERIFNGLSEGGTVQMPFQKTFWSDGFGMLVDRFGIPWMVNCDATP